MNNTNKTAKRHTKKLYPALVSQRAMLNTKGWSDAALVSQSSESMSYTDLACHNSDYKKSKKL